MKSKRKTVYQSFQLRSRISIQKEIKTFNLGSYDTTYQTELDNVVALVKAARGVVSEFYLNFKPSSETRFLFVINYSDIFEDIAQALKKRIIFEGKFYQIESINNLHRFTEMGTGKDFTELIGVLNG